MPICLKRRSSAAAHEAARRKAAHRLKTNQPKAPSEALV